MHLCSLHTGRRHKCATFSNDAWRCLLLAADQLLLLQCFPCTSYLVICHNRHSTFVYSSGMTVIQCWAWHISDSYIPCIYLTSLKCTGTLSRVLMSTHWHLVGGFNEYALVPYQGFYRVCTGTLSRVLVSTHWYLVGGFNEYALVPYQGF